MSYKVRAEDVIRIEMIDRPETNEKGEGLYEWRHLKTVVSYDVLGIRKAIKSVMPLIVEDIMDRVFNFRIVYINTVTKEVTT